jgi:hypothetical protein
MGGMVRDFIVLLRMEHNLKFMNWYSWNVPLKSFGPQMVAGN